MSATRLRGGSLLLVSVVVHTLAIVAVSAMALRTPISPLFVDLTQDGPAAEGTPSGGRAATAAPPGLPAGDSPTRRVPSVISGPVPRVHAAPPALHVVERPAESSASPSAAPAAPSEPSPITPAPAARAAVDATPAPADSAGDGKPSGTGALAPSPASGSGSGRSAGGAAEAGGAGPGMAAPGGARLVLALPGDGRGGAPAEYGPYLARFRRSVEDALVYPLAARRQGLAGRVELDVLLEPSGRITAVEIHTSSSHGMLDEAGIAAVRSLPLMPFPESLPRRPLRIRLPLDFHLR